MWQGQNIDSMGDGWTNIIKKVDQNEYKRNQSAPGLKISPLAFGIGRRMPLVQKYQN